MPGIGQPPPNYTGAKFAAYYQWCPYVLFVQSLLFRVPYSIWKYLEGNRIEHLRKSICELVSRNEKGLGNIGLTVYCFIISFTLTHIYKKVFRVSILAEKA